MVRRVFFWLLPVVILLAACAAPASTSVPYDETGASAVTSEPTVMGQPARTAAQSATQPTRQPTVEADLPGTEPTRRPTVQAQQSTAQPTGQPTAAAAQAPGQPAGENYRLVIVPDGTEARFRVKEQLAGNSLPGDAVGATRAVTGQVVITPSGAFVPGQSRITVDMTSLKTDQGMRDNFIKQSTLQTSQYPKAEFVPTSVQGLPSPLPTSGDVSFQITGDMTVHGVTKPATWQVKATIKGKEVTGTATAAFKFADFNMSPPKVARVLSVEDNIRLELDFHVVAQ